MYNFTLGVFLFKNSLLVKTADLLTMSLWPTMNNVCLNKIYVTDAFFSERDIITFS